jgi:hypothetical protein
MRYGFLIAAFMLLMSCVRQSDPPRSTSAAEAAEILAPLMPYLDLSKICVDTSLRPPLEEERKYASRETRDQWKAKQFALRWSPRWGSGGKDISDEQVARLDRSLEQAAFAEIRKAYRDNITLPKGIRGCDRGDLELAAGSSDNDHMVWRFSRPVVVGEFAFVEWHSVGGCDICGAGHLEALIRRNRRWTPLADILTEMG